MLLVLLLVATNLATLIYLWLPPKNRLAPPNRKGPDLLIKELKLTDSQQASFSKLRDEYQADIMPLRDQMKNAKDDFFSLLKTDTANTIVVEVAAAKSARVQQLLDMANFDHFKKVRSICSPEQQERFDEIIQDVMRQMGPSGGRPQGQHPPDGPGNRPDGPPPPNGPPPQ